MFQKTEQTQTKRDQTIHPWCYPVELMSWEQMCKALVLWEGERQVNDCPIVQTVEAVDIDHSQCTCGLCAEYDPAIHPAPTF